MNYYIQPATNYASQGTLARQLINYINTKYAEFVISRGALDGEVIDDIQRFATFLNEQNPRCKSTSARIHHPDYMEGAKVIVDSFSIICKPVRGTL